MKSFSMRTLLLLCAIAALCVSHVVMMRRLDEAQAEVEAVRRGYGYVQISDDSKVYVAPLAQHKGKYRIVVPPGDRYFLHLTELDAATTTIPVDKKPWITVSLNGWKDGADEILSCSVGWDLEKDIPKLRVASHASQFFTYTPDNWDPGVSMVPEQNKLDAVSQTDFAIDEDILLMHCWTPSLNRGVMLWLEPEINRKSRRTTRSK